VIRTIFEEKYDIGYSEGKADGYFNGKAEGIAEGEAIKGKNILLKILRARFHRVPRDVEKLIKSMTDPVALDSWAVHAATCQSMNEIRRSNSVVLLADLVNGNQKRDTANYEILSGNGLCFDRHLVVVLLVGNAIAP